MKTLFIIVALFLGWSSARAQIPVTDAASIANNRATQAENLAKWVESINHLRPHL